MLALIGGLITALTIGAAFFAASRVTKAQASWLIATYMIRYVLLASYAAQALSHGLGDRRETYYR